jgi:hypothetical protein
MSNRRKKWNQLVLDGKLPTAEEKADVEKFSRAHPFFGHLGHANQCQRHSAYGHCFRMSAVNVIQDKSLSEAFFEDLMRRHNFPAKNGNLLGGFDDVVARAALKEKGWTLTHMTKKFAWGKEPKTKILENPNQRVILVGYPPQNKMWKHAICIQAGWAHDPDWSFPARLTASVLDWMIEDVTELYLVDKLVVDDITNHQVLRPGAPL